MRQSMFEWDMIVIMKNGEESLLSELGPEIFCTPCGMSVKVEGWQNHLVKKHGWRVTVGETK